MLLRALTLINIRSYAHAQILFPEGITLLAGDIGSGKSTVLLATEFALFGVQRGELSASSLLRHGASRGEVSLTLQLESKEVTITRSLKRGANTIAQEAGSITVDGVMRELTAQELKARVLELLRYPASLLAKGKGNLFRYTVYTPQEEMKAILAEKGEERLDTLRRLFDIDKYKRVRENGLLLLRELRRDETATAARIEEFAKQLVKEEQFAAKLHETLTAMAAVSASLAEARMSETTTRKSLDEQEKTRFQSEELQKRVAVTATRHEQLGQRLLELDSEAARLAEQVATTLLNPDDADETKLLETERLLDDQEKKIREKERLILKQETEYEHAARHAREVITLITSLAQCPTCRQDVDASHKTRIVAEEETRRASAERKSAELARIREELQRHRDALATKQHELLQKRRLVEATKEKLKNLADLRRRLDALTLRKNALLREAESTRREKERLEEELRAQRPFDEAAYRSLRRELEERRRASSMLLVKETELKKDAERLTAEIARVTAIKTARQSQERRLAATRRRLAWIQKHLLSVSSETEKALFHAVYGLFNDYFRDWFRLLMEDESMTVRLDAEFTPVITQNGYETDLENLSGGEKTSVALAYRLALNKAINDFLASINTKGLLILDEPTDGFSSEQLDRVREMLDRLQLRQILIVSHEEQLEGYADHVIRIMKEGHESRITA